MDLIKQLLLGKFLKIGSLKICFLRFYKISFVDTTERGDGVKERMTLQTTLICKTIS
jgi:hypothetical protein